MRKQLQITKYKIIIMILYGKITSESKKLKYAYTDKSTKDIITNISLIEESIEYYKEMIERLKESGGNE